MASDRMNFAGVNCLIVDNDTFAVRLLAQILRGFGLNTQSVAETGEEAKSLLERGSFDLIICEALLPDMSAAELLRWIRKHSNSTVKFAPVIVLTGYTQTSKVTSIRDAGAHNVVKKPVAPVVLLDHIGWAARTPRPFVETANYAGPDRRFKYAGPPDGIGRRDTDLPPEVGQATEPNMSQDEIDALLKPNKVTVL